MRFTSLLIVLAMAMGAHVWAQPGKPPDEFEKQIRKLDRKKLPIQQKSAKPPSAKLPWTLGMSLHLVHDQQGEREFENSDSSRYLISKFAGSSQFLSLFAQKQVAGYWSVRGSLVMRKTEMSGDAVPLATASADPLPITRQQFFVGAACSALYHWGKVFRVGLVGEGGKATSVDLKINGAQQEITDSELPAYFMLALQMGGEWLFSQRFFLATDLRYGTAPTTSPSTQTMEFVLSSGWRF